MNTYFSNNLGWNDCFTDNRLPSSFYPVYSSRFFVRTIVTTYSYNLEIRKLFIQPYQCFFSTLLEEKQIKGNNIITVLKQATQGQWGSKIRLSLIKSSVTVEEMNIVSGRNLDPEKKNPIITIFFSNYFGNYIGNNCFSLCIWTLWIHSRCMVMCLPCWRYNMN